MNSLTIIGNLVRDPETRTTSDSKTVCNFTVAVNRRQKDKDGNSVADFFRVSAWNKTGEVCQKFLTKGRKVAVTGSVSVHAFLDKEGNPKGSLEVFAQDVEFLSSGKDSEQSSPAPATQTDGTQVNIDESELPF